MDFHSLSKEDKTDFYIALAVIALASIFILYYTFSNTGLASSDMHLAINDNTQEIEEVILEDSRYMPLEEDFVDREMIAGPAEIHTITPSQVSRQNNDLIYSFDNESEKENNLIPAAEDKEIVPVIPEENLSKGIIKEDKLIDSSISKTTIQAPNNTSSTLEKTPVDQEDKVNRDTSKDCVIIVGAFTKQKNIDKLKRGLVKDGYDLFTTPYKGTTRVGVYQPCNTQSIRTNLSQIRKKYAKDAMILRAE